MKTIENLGPRHFWPKAFLICAMLRNLVLAPVPQDLEQPGRAPDFRFAPRLPNRSNRSTCNRRHRLSPARSRCFASRARSSHSAFSVALPTHTLPAFGTEVTGLLPFTHLLSCHHDSMPCVPPYWASTFFFRVFIWNERQFGVISLALWHETILILTWVSLHTTNSCSILCPNELQTGRVGLRDRDSLSPPSSAVAQ